jgi:hydrogenase expression/formation protein HypC
MCLAIPVRVTELLDNDMAIAEVGGVRKEIALHLVEGVQPGDYVILHVGYAITRLDEAEAVKTLALFEAMGREAAEPAA